jgi:hypothetical protein
MATMFVAVTLGAGAAFGMRECYQVQHGRAQIQIGRAGVGEIDTVAKPTGGSLPKPAQSTTDRSFHGCQPAIKLIGECLPVAQGEIRWSPHNSTTAAHLINQVPHREPLPDIGIGVKLATRI